MRDRARRARVVSDGQVCPAAHFEHCEALVHLDWAHADLFIEARCRGGVAAMQSHVAGPDRRTGIAGIMRREADRR
jgi:hypothetical protein